MAIWQSVPFLHNEGISLVRASLRRPRMYLIVVFTCMETVAPTLLDQFSDSRKIGVDCFSIGRFCPMAGRWATKRDDLRRVGGRRTKSPAPGIYILAGAEMAGPSSGDGPANPGIPASRKTGNSNRSTACPSSPDFSLPYRLTLHTPHTLHGWAVMTAIWRSVARHRHRVIRHAAAWRCGGVGMDSSPWL